MSEKYIGIDIGGTSARVGEFDGLDLDTVRKREDFQISNEYPEDMERLAATIRKLTEGDSPAGVGLGIAGEFNEDRSRLVQSPNAQGWVDRPLREDLAAELGCRVVLINDAEAGAWAEAGFGGHDQDFWFITWGTGVGGGIVEQCSGGPHVIAAEPGHHVIRWDETSPQCNCGKRGCIEAYVGGAKIAERFGKPAAELSDKEWEDVTDWFARGLYSVIRTRPVNLVVMGGGVASKQARHLPEIERKLNEYLGGLRAVKVSGATHGEDAGMVGALAALRAEG
ncbi:MAG: ROK family protein [bacterium]|nr:ROK family protein [bacterium]